MIAGLHNHILLRGAAQKGGSLKEASCFTSISRSLASCEVLNPQISNRISTRLPKSFASWVLPGSMSGISFEPQRTCVCGQRDSGSPWRVSATISFRAFAFTYRGANARDRNVAGVRLSWDGRSGLSNICDGSVFCQLRSSMLRRLGQPYFRSS